MMIKYLTTSGMAHYHRRVMVAMRSYSLFSGRIGEVFGFHVAKWLAVSLALTLVMCAIMI